MASCVIAAGKTCVTRDVWLEVFDNEMICAQVWALAVSHTGVWTLEHEAVATHVLRCFTRLCAAILHCETAVSGQVNLPKVSSEDCGKCSWDCDASFVCSSASSPGSEAESYEPCAS